MLQTQAVRNEIYKKCYCPQCGTQKNNLFERIQIMSALIIIVKIYLIWRYDSGGLMTQKFANHIELKYKRSTAIIRNRARNRLLQQELMTKVDITNLLKIT